MKLLLKIAALAVVGALMLFVWICKKVLYCSAYALGMLGFLVVLLAMVMFLIGATQSAVILLVTACLISPLGLPIAAVWILARIQDVRYAIQDFVYS